MIGSLDASGGTDIRQALEAALEMMRGVRAQYRHIILMSDGRPNSDVELRRPPQPDARSEDHALDHRHRHATPTST